MRGDFNELMAEFEQQKRHDYFLDLWEKWGNWAIVAISAVLVGTASWSVYEYSLQQKRIHYANLYEEGKKALVDKNEKKGKKLLEDIGAYGVPNYRAMARLALAEYFLENKMSNQAYEQFKKMEADHVIKPFYKGLATLNRLKLDIEKGVDKRLVLSEIDPLIVQHFDLKPAAMEFKGYVLTEVGEYRQARDTFIDLAQSQQTDPHMRKRAHSMIRFISVKYLNE